MAKKTATQEETSEDEANKIAGFDIKAFKKQWKDKLVLGAEFKDDDLKHIPTGSIKLDWAMRRPFLEGSMVEVYAPQGVGKTTLCLHVCSNAIKMGKPVFYIDLEFKLRESQIDMIQGLEKDKMTILFPDNGEEAMNMMYDLMVNFPGCVLVVDSVGGILPETEAGDDFNKTGMAEVARLCHKMVRKLAGINNRNKCVTIFINHLTSTMSMYGPKNTTHGGNAIRNRAAQRIELKAPAGDAIKDEKGEIIGQKVTAVVVKNNVNRPHISVTFPIIYGKGIDAELDLLEFALGCGVINKTGGWYDYKDEKFRETDLLTKLKLPEFKDAVTKEVMTILQ